MPQLDRMTVTSTVLPRMVKAAGSGCFLLVKPVGLRGVATPELVDQVRQCLAVANTSVPARTVVGGASVATKKGIAISVLLGGSPLGLEDPGVIEAWRRWIDVLVAGLEEQGIAGSLAPSGKGVNLDPLMYANVGRAFPAAFVGYRLGTHPPREDRLNAWLVPADTTAIIARSLQTWVAAPGLEVWLKFAHGRIPSQPEQIAEFLAFSSEHSGYHRGVICVDPERTVSRAASLGQLGTCVTQFVNSNLGWQELLDTQLDAMLLDPLAADVGHIKNIGSGATHWNNLDVRGQREHRTVRLPLDYDNSRHLWDEYVIDAAGVSLLTGKHLAHAHDLSNWDIEEVAPDRYLVKAKDLSAWYADIVPMPEVIAQARADFGDMILTWDTIVANPGPYTVTGSIVGR